MVLSPKIYIDATYNGILAWAVNVLPSVLPFMFFTKVLTNLGFTEKFSSLLKRPCQKLFNCSSVSSFVFLTSIISGYPVGATMTADLYQSGKITKSEAFRMCSFCSTSGPMFIVGTVGIAMLGNAKFGYIILISHILGAILNGILYRKMNVYDIEKTRDNSGTQKNSSLSAIVQESVLNILSVGAIIAIFFVIINALSPIFNIFPSQISCILEGLIEITKGCLSISQNLSGLWAIVGATFVISFGGLSTILQSFAMLSRLQMPIKLFILQKTTHALLATVVSAILCLIIL